MTQVEIGLRLKRLREPQNLRLAKQLARQVQRGRGAMREAIGHADDGMTGSIGQRLVTADEQIEIAKRFVELLHHMHAVAIRLDEFDGRDEVPAANLVRPPALFTAPWTRDGYPRGFDDQDQTVVTFDNDQNDAPTFGLCPK